MKNFRPQMFKEAEKSVVTGNLILQLLIFLLVFIIITIAESIVPAVIALPELITELAKNGLFSFDIFNIDIEAIVSVSSDVMSRIHIFVPTLLFTGAGTLISIVYCRFIEKRSLGSMGVRKHRAVPHYLLGVLVGFLLMTAITLSSLAFGVCNISLNSSVNFGHLLLYLQGFLIQGMSEEFIFRGYLMSTIGGKHRAVTALLISSAAFAVAHAANPGFNLLVFFNLTLFGIFAGLYIICFDDIWGACAIHTMWNFNQGNFYGISISGTKSLESVFTTSAISSSDILTGGKFGIEGSIFTTAVLVIASGLVLLKIYRKK